MLKLYKIERNFLDKDQCYKMARRLEELLQKEIYRPPDSQCTLSPAFYGIFNDEMAASLKKLEEITELELYPVYTYARIYQENDFLLPHIDRPGAEVSLTITLDYDQYIWPIWVDDPSGNPVPVTLDIGDALIYEGTKLVHYRHKMIGQDFQHQTFFHFVKKNGEYSHLKYDQSDHLLSNTESEACNFPEWSYSDFKAGLYKSINNKPIKDTE